MQNLLGRQEKQYPFLKIIICGRVKLFSSTENKDLQEELLILLPAQKILQRKASLRIAKLRKEKLGQKLRKTEQQREENFFRGTSATQIKKL